MSSGSIAIIIASVSALFTGANMLVSLATYRRGRPRVYMSMDWNPWAPPPWAPDARRGYFTVRVINKSQAAVKVSRLYAEFDRGRSRTHLRRSRCPMEIIKGGEERDIPPFGGVEWTAQLDTPRTFLPMNVKRTKLTAVLTNGTRVQSKWVLKVPRPLLGPWSEPAERSGQLSFDDLEEVG